MPLNKCSPAEMRKNMEAVEQLRRHGFDFVPIPVTNPAHKLELIDQMDAVFKEMEPYYNDTT